MKLSDSVSSTSGTSGGIAATPAAVKSAYDLANTANNKTLAGWAWGTGSISTTKAYLQIRIVEVGIAYNSSTTKTFTKFPNGAIIGIPKIYQPGFAAGSSVNVQSLSNGSVTVYQYNTQSASLTVQVVIFGY